MAVSVSRRDLGVILVLFLLTEVLDQLRDRSSNRESATFELDAQAADELFSGWQAAQPSGRRSGSTEPSVFFDFAPPRVPIDAFLLELKGSSEAAQWVTAQLNDHELGSAPLPDEPGSVAVFLVDRAYFVNDLANRLDLRPGSSEPEVAPEWLLLESLTLRPAPIPVSGISFGDSLYFAQGFSSAEQFWRWSDGASARLRVPLNRPLRTVSYELRVLAGTTGRRTAKWLVNGEPIGSMTFDGWEADETSLAFAGTLLRSGINDLELELDSVFTAPGDERKLGLAIRWLAILPDPGPG